MLLRSLKMSNITEQQKVQKLYNEIGKRGLYVSSNFDVFTEKPDEIPLAMGAGYKVNLVQPGSNSYASPLLFATLTSLLNHGTMLIKMLRLQIIKEKHKNLIQV